MTKEEMIVKYVSEHPEPIQEKCPILIQKTKKSDGYHYWFSNDGHKVVTKKEVNLPNEIKREEDIERYSLGWFCRTPNGSLGYYAAYANYIKELDAIELAAAWMAGNTGKENKGRKWEFNHDSGYWNTNQTRLFMFKKDKHLYDENGKIWHKNAEGEVYNKDFRWYCNELERMIVTPTCEKEFTAYTGVKTFHVSSWTNVLAYPWSWEVYYRKTCPKKEKSAQKKINEIINIKLTPLKELENKYPLNFSIEKQKDYYNGGFTEYLKFGEKDYCHFEIVNDEFCVIRYLQRNDDRYHCKVDKEFYEPYRIYIDKKGRAYITQLIEGKYEITSLQVKNLSSYYFAPKFGNILDIFKWERLKWIQEPILNTSDEYITPLIVALLRHPILERVYKSGYKNIFMMLKEDYAVTRNLKEIFGVTEKKRGSITQLLGVNKATLKWLDEHYSPEYKYRYRKIISCIKEIFGTDDISSWSQESIDIYFKGAITLLMKDSNWKYSLKYGHCYGRDAARPLTEEERKKYQKVLRSGAKDERVIELLVDTLNLWRGLNNKPDIHEIYDVTNVQEMVRYHDAIQTLYNEQEAQRRAYWDAKEKKRLEMDKKKFGMLQEERIKKFEYETEDDEFIIRVPHELSEITNEGIALHHCVGGYLHRHAVGETNIIFLRHKDLPTVPYYTIEVDNNHIVQIHGKNNKWLGAAIDADKVIPFVIKWLKKTGILCDSKILLCKATGYCSNNDCLDGAQFGL